MRAVHHVVAERLAERLRHLVADLVAARADARPDRRRPAAPPPSAATPSPTIPPRRPRQPAWRIAIAGSPCRCARSRSAGSRPSGAASRGPARRSTGRRMVVHGPGRDDAARLGSRHRGAVTLPRHGGAVRIGADRLAQAAPVLDHARGVVVGADAEVERGERALAHAAQPRRERDAVRAGRLPARSDRDRPRLAPSRAASSARACSGPGRRRPPRAARSASPSVGPGLEAERDEVVAVDREVASRCGLERSRSSAAR